MNERKLPFEIQTLRSYKPAKHTRIYKTLKKALMLEKEDDVEFTILVSFSHNTSYNTSRSERGEMTMTAK